jgi:UDP-2,3-diacylglucosamine hydrolase
MKAIFISDAHLKRVADERYGQLVNFFNDIRDGKVKSLIDSAGSGGKVTPITDLFIVGDLFDFWFCNKNKIYPEFILIINKLMELQKSGIHIHLSEGNHDFFLKEYFHDVLGMEVFEEWADVKLESLRALIAHGDTTDKTNFKYRLFRKILRSRLFYHFQRFIPARIRWILASVSSVASKEMTIEDGDVLVEKMLAFAVDKFQKDYDAVIVGHCHIPVLRHYTVAGKKKTFAALGDWIDHYSFLYYENKNFYLGYYQWQDGRK